MLTPHCKALISKDTYKFSELSYFYFNQQVIAKHQQIPVKKHHQLKAAIGCLKVQFQVFIAVVCVFVQSAHHLKEVTSLIHTAFTAKQAKAYRYRSRGM